MAINFPDTPTTGQTYTVGSVTWTYDGAKWAGLASVTGNIAGGVAGSVPYQTGTNVTGMTAAGTKDQVLTSNGTSAPTWANNIHPFLTMGA
jgi:hypothetical protein